MARQEPPDGPWRWPPASFLGAMNVAACRMLLRLGARREYPQGDHLMVQGDLTDHVVVLIDGIVKVTAVTGHGAEDLLAARVGGDVVGEIAGMSGQARSATVTAAGTVVGQRLTRVEFDAFLRRHPLVAQTVSTMLAARLSSTVGQRVAHHDTVPVRLARVLLDLLRQHGEPVPAGIMIDLPLTWPELASLAGAAEPAVHDALRQLRDEGILATGHHRMIIRDVAGLRYAAGEDRGPRCVAPQMEA